MKGNEMIRLKEELDKEVSNITLSPKNEIEKLIKILRVLKGYINIKQVDSTIEVKKTNLSIKKKILLILLARYIMYRINYIYTNIFKEQPIYKHISEPYCEFREILNLTGVKKGTASGTLTLLAKNLNYVKKIGRSKYMINEALLEQIVEYIEAED